MQVKYIVDLLKSGIKPVVKLTGKLWEDSWGEKDMVARIDGFTQNDEFTDKGVEFNFDYSIAKEHNMSIQRHDYRIFKDVEFTGKLGTAAEAGMKEKDYIKETIIFEEKDEIPVILYNDGDNCLKRSVKDYFEYASKNPSPKPYVEWLEEQYDNYLNYLDSLSKALFSEPNNDKEE